MSRLWQWLHGPTADTGGREAAKEAERRLREAERRLHTEDHRTARAERVRRELERQRKANHFAAAIARVYRGEHS